MAWWFGYLQLYITELSWTNTLFCTAICNDFWAVYEKIVRPSEQCTKRQHIWKFIPILYYKINRFKYVWYDHLVICNYIWKNYHEQLCYITSLSTMTSEQCMKRQSGPLNSVRKDSQTLWTVYEKTVRPSEQCTKRQ